MRSPPAPRIRLSAYQSRARDIAEGRHLAIAERHIDMLALPRLPPRDQRGHDGVARVQPRRQIRHRHSHLHGWPIPRARDVHETHFGFDHDVVASAGAVRARLAVSRDAGVDQTRIQGVDGGKVHVVFFEGVGEVVLHQYVGGLGEGMEDFLTGFRGEGEPDGFFVAIDLGGGGRYFRWCS